MTKLLKLAALTAAAFCSLTASAQTSYIAEAPRGQKSLFNESENHIVISAKAPTTTEYDWETYEQFTLPYISYVAIERHISNTAWGENDEIGRVENPTPGEVFTFTDTQIETDKKYEYRLTCYVDETKGSSCYVQAYTGIIPGELQALSVSVTDHNATTADFSITAPQTSAAGNELTTPMSIVIQQEIDWTYEELHVIDNVAPGATITWQHADLTLNKSYHYRVFARIGSQGSGQAESADVFVGLDVPGMPVDFKAVAEGEGARLTWKHAATGSRGGSFDPENTTYTITRKYNDGTEELAAKGVKGTEYIDNPGFDEACTAAYTIIGINKAGDGYKEATCPAISFGKPAKLPFSESFADAKLQHNGWVKETSQDDEYYTYDAWEFAASGTMYDFTVDDYISISPADNDNGLASCRFYGYSADGQTESLISPAINTEGQTELTLSFHHFVVGTETSANSLIAYVSRNGGDWEEVYTHEAPATANAAWKQASVDITLDGTCPNIKVKIDAIRHGNTVTNVYLDNITVETKQAGINNISADDAAQTVEYFNLRGMKLPAAPTAPGLYIRKQGTETTKFVK